MINYEEFYRKNDEVEVVIVSIHGILSNNKNMHKLMEYTKSRLADNNYHYTEIKYGFTLGVLNAFPYVRNLTRDNISARISNISNKYRNAKIIIIAHSNGTWALGRGIEKWYKSTNMRIGMVVLVGSVLKRSFPWYDFPEISVLNIVATRDWVSLISKWTYGMGQSGVKGFNYISNNLKEVKYKMGHTGFIENSRNKIVYEIKKYLNLV